MGRLLLLAASRGDDEGGDAGDRDAADDVGGPLEEGDEAVGALFGGAADRFGGGAEGLGGGVDPNEDVGGGASDFASQERLPAGEVVGGRVGGIVGGDEVGERGVPPVLDRGGGRVGVEEVAEEGELLRFGLAGRLGLAGADADVVDAAPLGVGPRGASSR